MKHDRAWKFTATILLVILVGLLSASRPTSRAAPAPHALPEQELVPADAGFVLSVRVAELWNAEAFRAVRQFAKQNEGESDVAEMLFGLPPGDVERLTVFSRNGATLGLLTTSKRLDRSRLLQTFPPDTPERLLNGKSWYRDEEVWRAVAFLDERSALIGAADVVEELLRPRPTRNGLQAETLRLLRGKHPVVFGMTRDGDCGLDWVAKRDRALFEDFHPALKAQFILITTEAGKEVRTELVARYADADAVRAAERAVPKARDVALEHLSDVRREIRKVIEGRAENLGVSESVMLAAIDRQAAAVRSLKTDREGVELRASLRMPAADVSAFLLSYSVGAAYAGSITRPDRKSPVARVAAVLLRYHKERGHLPPAALCDRDGRPLLSWRVLVLPYLGDEGKTLHKQFKLDEPWDGPNNIKLVRKMPRLFAQDADDNATTNIQVFTGKGTLFDGPKGRPLSEAKDGAANTVLVTEGFRKIPWTKPEDLPFAADKPLPPVGNSFVPRDIVHVAFADGEVRTLPANGEGVWEKGKRVWQATPDFDETNLKGFITREGGETVDRESAQIRSTGLGTPPGGP